MESRQYIPQAEAARRLGVSNETFLKLTGGIAPLVRSNPDGRGVSLADVLRFEGMPSVGDVADHPRQFQRPSRT